MRLTAMFLVFILFGCFAFGQSSTTSPLGTLQDNLALYVCSNAGMKVVKFDSQTGTKLADFEGAEEPVDVDVGPGDYIFATDEATGAANVRRFNPETGEADADPYGDTSLYLGGPRGLAFGPDGHLYVADMLYGGISEVVEFDDTGAFVQVLPDDPDLRVLISIEDVACDGSGAIYVTQWLYEGTEITGVHKFTGTGWQLFGGTGDLLFPWGLAFGPDKHLYVVDEDPDHFGVYVYDGTTGAAKGLFGETGVNLSEPRYLTFGPDGDLYVADATDNTVRKFSGPLKPDAGTYNGPFGETGANLSDPIGLVFGPSGGVQPQKPTLAIEKVANGNMLLTLTGTAGKSYELRHTPDATVSDFTTWTFGATITLEGTTTGTWEDAAPADQRRFYKAKEQ